MIMERIQEAKAGFGSFTEAIDTTTAPGRMMMQMVGAFAEFERAILRERTKAGLDAASKQGTHRRGDGQSSDPINRMKSLRWYQWVPKLPLTPQDFSMCIRRQCRGFWLKRVPGLSV
jgi:DNA invertase Pin-like site-specific DNA recombinase